MVRNPDGGNGDSVSLGVQFADEAGLLDRGKSPEAQPADDVASVEIPDVWTACQVAGEGVLGQVDLAKLSLQTGLSVRGSPSTGTLVIENQPTNGHSGKSPDLTALEVHLAGMVQAFGARITWVQQ